jgi:hypothetical protein
MAREIRGPETGGGSPKAGQQGDTALVAAAMVVLLVVSPVALVLAIGAVLAILRQVRRHWWEVAGLAGVGAVGVVLVEQFLGGGFVPFHFGPIWEALTAGGSWVRALVMQVPFAVPLGIGAGALYVGLSESWTGGAEWHPVEQRRRTVNEARAETRRAAVVNNADTWTMASTPPLGVLHDGDLRGWTEDPFVIVPPGRFPAMGLIGSSGSGKTVTAERMVTLWARSGRKVIFCDFKGSDPELAERVVAAYQSARPEALCALWPAQPLDMWRGSPTEIANRLLQVQDYSEPYYQAVAETIVRLVMHAPDVDGTGPVRDSASFLARLDAEFLHRAYEGDRAAAQDVASVTRQPQAIDGVRLRYSGFFAALAGRLDHGWSFEDVDCAILSVPTLAQRSDAMAVARMVLTDFAGYCLRRKPRLGEDVTLIIDEFSAVTAAAPLVIDLAERVRDVGGQVVVSVQSFEGLGADDAERRRMLGALVPGGLVVHRLADPDEVVRPAGTVRAVEQSWQLEDRGVAGMGSAKMTHKMRVDPDAVRQAKTGEAWIVTEGRAAHMTVLRSRISDEDRDRARRLIEAARMQAEADLRVRAVAERQDWWDVRLPVLEELRRPELEAASLDELTAGDDPPPQLPPGPDPVGPDARIVLAVAAYVRAGQVEAARQVAATTDTIEDPERYVAEVAQRRAAEVSAIRNRRRA